MRSIKIPKEYKGLRQAARRTNAKHAVIALLWYGFWTLTFMLYEFSGRLPHNWWRLGVLSALIIAFGLYFSKLPTLFKGSFEGVLERIKYGGVYATSGAERKKSFRAYSRMILIVRLENGRIKRLRFPLKAGHKRYYTEGYSIVKYNGLTYPYSPKGVSRGVYVCLNCGGVEMKPRADCLGCGCPIMNPNKELPHEQYETVF